MRVLVVGSREVGNIGAVFTTALEVLGYEFCFVESDYLRQRSALLHRVASRFIGRRPLTYWKTNREVLEVARKYRPQIILIVKGIWLSPETLAQLKTKETRLINYATDDPFNPAVSRPDLVSSIPLYDLYVCTKRAIMDDVRRSGCPNVVYIPFGYEPGLHFPERPATREEADRFTSDVVFIGGGDPERRPIMRKLATTTEKLHLYGGFWNRDRRLAPYYRGFAQGRDFRLALGGAKIAPGLVRRANRDGHSMRSFEVPACGAFMLAERTEEHLEYFEEDKEAAYFGSDEEMLDKVRYYLTHDAERQRIAKAGYERVTTGANTYQDRLKQILESAKALF